ncbi:UDP-N-acetylmuramoyl-L-alanyl-D-glutamate--2,6-diaminopimelate ligase [Bacillus fonticola]|uniref:UDP-N-acetylmuramoyl-L-alanyl-D-glutamate--2, 6-diaminopimelate ligase n=1 Tax=Bacillus fonticola TaxID=2728853 RepID=UPI001475E599|nr:UDP-N-acetylmuramoyl-L-alanyl-D-glutamate--2,6-diaminopimelate ligase [Bacillus fonticola]
MKASDLFQRSLLGSLPDEVKALDITGVEQNSRLVKKGHVFICIKGYTVDGHDFVEQAVKNGAALVVAERTVNVDVPVLVVPNSRRMMGQLAVIFYGAPSQKLSVIGVTGTNGKTSTTHFIEAMFRNLGNKTGLIGTMYYKIGDRSYPTKNTTPDSLTLQRIFAEMVEAGVDVCVMEVSSHALIEGRMHGVDVDVAAFTNLTQDHLDFHDTMTDYLYAKGLLFSQLGSMALLNGKAAVINADDSYASQLVETSAAPVFTYGLHKHADVRAPEWSFDAKGLQCTVEVGSETFHLTLPLVGEFMVYNVLAAMTVCLTRGVSPQRCIEAMKAIKGVPGRFELVPALADDVTVIVDYAHTPDSLGNVLKTAKQITERKLWVVVGCGGDRDRKKRPIMASIACEVADHAVFTSDNPRTEEPEKILHDMEEGVPSRSYTSILDRREAIFYAIEQAERGDVIVIAGKGHETYQILKDRTIDFDDRLVAKECLEARYS